MTFGVAVKVFDGIVLATDSATTMASDDGVQHVYNNANKIFHLHRQRPVAAMTWGLGNLGSASIATLAKEFRRRLMGKSQLHKAWKLAPTTSVEIIAGRLIEMIYPMYAQEHGTAGEPPYLGFLVAGYSADDMQAEAWRVDFKSTTGPPSPQLIIPRDLSGFATFAQPEATQRLFNGYDPGLAVALKDALSLEEWQKVEALVTTSGPFNRPVVQPAMPIADAIELARFMVNTTAGFTHYSFGPDTVGGPVEVASMTRHEGFKWIARKHYFSSLLNPEEVTHAY